MNPRASKPRKSSGGGLRGELVKEREFRDRQHEQNQQEFQETRKAIRALGERMDTFERHVGEELRTNTELCRQTADTAAAIRSSVDSRAQTFDKVAEEYESREAVRAWWRKRFSSTRSIVTIVGGVAVGVSGLSGFVTWALSHIK